LTLGELLEVFEHLNRVMARGHMLEGKTDDCGVEGFDAFNLILESLSKIIVPSCLLNI
jgi:hypothetical protein